VSGRPPANEERSTNPTKAGKQKQKTNPGIHLQNKDKVPKQNPPKQNGLPWLYRHWQKK